MEIFYYPRVMRRITIALLDMFNKMQVYNYNSTSAYLPEKIIDVPIKFGPGDKAFLFQVQRESGKPYYAKVPSLLLTLNDMSYNSDRATSVNELRELYNDSININYVEKFWEDVQPTPYDYTYTLEVRTESMDHLNQILENITPYFNPTNHLRIKEFDFLNLERNLRVELQGGVQFDYPQEMGEEDYRFMNAKITLLVHGYVYRPISTSAIIKYIKTNYIYDGKNAETYNTSGLTNTNEAPDDYTYKKAFDKDTTSYTKVSDSEVINDDQLWDAGIDVNTDSFVFKIPQPIQAPNGGVGEYPDAGMDLINIEEYVFNDGTYVENTI